MKPAREQPCAVCGSTDVLWSESARAWLCVEDWIEQLPRERPCAPLDVDYFYRTNYERRGPCRQPNRRW